jgi:hypothetical protein
MMIRMMESTETLELRSELERERKKSETLSRELQKAKESQIQLAREKELEEEKISNMLLRKITTLQREKERLIQDCEREEEFLTNTLQRQLEQVMETIGLVFVFRMNHEVYRWLGVCFCLFVSPHHSDCLSYVEKKLIWRMH